MKKTLIKRAKSLLAVMAGLAIVACSGEETRTNDVNTLTAVTQTSMFAETEVNCETVCISEGVYFPKTDQSTISWGGKDNNKDSKTVDVEYYNTETHFVLKVKSTAGWSDLVIDGVSVWTEGNVEANTWATYTYPLSEGWQACDTESFALKVTGNGPPANFNVNYNLIGVCPPCETGFTGKVVSCGTEREALYTFTSKEGAENFKIQGGLTNFTGEDAEVSVVGGSGVVVSQKTPGGSSNRVITVEGSVVECETVTVSVKWNSTNTGSKITGDWSVSAGDLKLEVAGLVCQ